MEPDDRPLFASVGRTRFRHGEGRSRAIILVVVIGLVAATLAFVYELRAIQRMTVVKVWLDLPVEVPPTPAPPP